MFSKIGPVEIIVILAICLLIFGPTVLPKVGKSIGKTISGFKSGLKSEENEIAEADKKDIATEKGE